MDERNDGFTSEEWHKEIGLVEKHLALFETYAGYYYFDKAVNVAKSMSTLEVRTSDARALLRCLIAIGGTQFSKIVNWEAPWLENLWSRAIISSEILELIEFEMFSDSETRREAIAILSKRYNELGEGNNPRLI